MRTIVTFGNMKRSIESSSHTTGHRLFFYCVVIALAAVVLFLRRPDSLLNPQFFAEDGIYFVDAYENGPMAILFPHDGYLHLLPRLVAAIALEFDPRWSPAFFNYAAYAVWLVLVAALFSSRIDLPLKPLLALALVLVPHSGEVFGFLYNIQWPLALGLVLLLVTSDADTFMRRVFDCAVALFCGLNGPYSVFLLPAFLIRIVIRRSRESIILAVVVAMTAVVQGILVYHSRTMFARSGPIDLQWLLSVLSIRLFGTFMAGYNLGQIPASAAYSAIGLGLMAILGLTAFRSGSWGKAQRMLLGAWFCLIIPVALKFLHEVGAISVPMNGDRYFFLPHVLLAWILIIHSDSFRKWGKPIGIAAIVIILAMNARTFQIEPLHDYAWAQHVQPIREGKAFSIPINPKGLFVESYGRDCKRQDRQIDH